MTEEGDDDRVRGNRGKDERGGDDDIARGDDDIARGDDDRGGGR